MKTEKSKNNKKITLVLVISIFLVLTLTLTLTTAYVVICNANGCQPPIDLKTQKEVTLEPGQKLTTGSYPNQKVYEAEPGSKFVFNEKEEFVEGTQYITSKEIKYNINGVDIKLPKGTTITYEKDKTVVNSENPLTLSLSKEEKQKVTRLIEFKSKDSIELQGKDKTKLNIKGLSKDGKKTDSSVFLDPNKKEFYIKKAEMDQKTELDKKEIGRNNFPNTYIFLDEDIPENFDKPALSKKDNQWTLRAGTTEFSADFSYQNEKKEKIIAQALVPSKPGNKPGEIKFTFPKTEKEITKVETKGNYFLVNGPLAERNGKKILLNENIKKLFNPSEKIMPMQVKSFDENGNQYQITGKDGKKVNIEHFYNINNKDFWIGIGGEKGIYYDEQGNVYSEEKDSNAVFHGANKEQNDKYRSLTNDERTEIFQRIARGESFGTVMDGISILPKSKAKILKVPEDAKYDFIPIHSGSDYSTNIHETVHLYLNKGVDWDPSVEGERRFWMGEGEYALVEKTGLIKGIVSASAGLYDSDILYENEKAVKDENGEYVWQTIERRASIVTPSTGATSNIPLEVVEKAIVKSYFESVYHRRDVLHTFEDGSAYRAGLRAIINRALTTSWSPGTPPPDVKQVFNFMILEGSVGPYVQEKKPSYLTSSKGVAFRGYIKAATEDSMEMINQVQNDPRLASIRPKQRDYEENWGPIKNIPDSLTILRTSTTTQATNLRQFYINNYDTAWTQKTLGFKYADGTRNE